MVPPRELGDRSSNAHPVTRMTYLIRYLKEQGFPNLDAPAQDIFQVLDKACKVVPYKECLEESVKLNQLVLRQMRKTNDDSAKGQARRAATEAGEFFCECHKYMAAIFLEDPESYSKPISYLDTNFERWLEPPVRCSFGRPFYRVKRTDLHKYQGVLLFEDHPDSDNVFLRQYVMQHPKETVDLNLASNWQFQCSLTDTLFAEFNRDKPEIEYQRDRLRQEGLYLIEVLA